MKDEKIKQLERWEINDYLSKVRDWQLIENNHLRKELEFIDFNDALKFINNVGKIAEKLDHHPNISLHDYKKVSIETFTHRIDGLSIKDFLLAKEIDKISV